jgi:hypothetical protein
MVQCISQSSIHGAYSEISKGHERRNHQRFPTAYSKGVDRELEPQDDSAKRLGSFSVLITIAPLLRVAPKTRVNRNPEFNA